MDDGLAPHEGWMSALSPAGCRIAEQVARQHSRYGMDKLVGAWVDSVRGIASREGEDYYDDYWGYIFWREHLDEVTVALPEPDAAVVRAAVAPADAWFVRHTVDDGGAALSRYHPRIRTDRWYWCRMPTAGPIAWSLGTAGPYPPGVTPVRPGEAEWIVVSGRLGGVPTYVLRTGAGAGRDAFFDAIRRTFPLDPPLVSNRSWDALADSLFGGLCDVGAHSVRVVWPDAHDWSPEAGRDLDIALEILDDMARTLAEPEYTDGRPVTVQVFVVGAGDRRPSGPTGDPGTGDAP